MNVASHEPEAARRSQDRREQRLLRRRHRRDRSFRAVCVAGVVVAASFPLLVLGDVFRRGAPALWQTEIETDVTLRPETLGQPRQAFSTEVRDLVSRAEIRAVPGQTQCAEVQVRLTYPESAVSDPSVLIRDLRLETTDLPAFLHGEGPWVVARRTLLELVDADAVSRQGRKLETNASLAGTRPQAWLRGSAELERFLRAGDGLSPTARLAVERLSQAGKLRWAYDRDRLGDGRTTRQWVLASSDVDQFVKRRSGDLAVRAERLEQLSRAVGMELDSPADLTSVLQACRQARASVANPPQVEMPADAQLQVLADAWSQCERMKELQARGQLRLRFNRSFFLNGDSIHPEAAGLSSACIGSAYVFAFSLLICVPIGLLTAIYLEEFASEGWLKRVIEFNVNLLRAIPSVLFGILGLAILINVFGFPRSSVLVGAITLGVMTFPVIVVRTQEALRTVPDSVRMAGYGLGATRWQVTLHHVLPLSLRPIFTHCSLGVVHAIGVTAPLIVVGLMAFSPDAPQNTADSSTVVPAQIYRWSVAADPAFQERAALAILLMLGVLFAIQAVAVGLGFRSRNVT